MPYTFAEEQVVLAHALDDPALNPSGEIRALVTIARALQSVPDPEIDPAFAARLEARLMAHASSPSLRPPSRTPSRTTSGRPASTSTHTAAVITLPRRRFVVRKAVAAVAAAAMLTALPVIASGSALPGSALYGVKQAMERLELVVTRGAVADGFVYLSHAHRRLGEVDQLVALGRDGFVAPTLARFDAAMRSGTTLILSATDDAVVLTRLAGVLHASNGRLSSLLKVAGPDAAPAIIDAIVSGRALSREVAEALGADHDDLAAIDAASAAGNTAARAPRGSRLGSRGTLTSAVQAPQPPASTTHGPGPIDEGSPKQGGTVDSRETRSSCAGRLYAGPASDTVSDVCDVVEDAQALDHRLTP